MHPLVRAIILWLVGIICISAPLAVYSIYVVFPFWEVLSVLDIFRIATVSSMLSFLFPLAYFGGNDGEWGEHPEMTVFVFTSFVVLPLMVIFPIDEQRLAAVFMDRDIPFFGFMVLWWGHGAVNALHVRILSQRIKH